MPPLPPPSAPQPSPGITQGTRPARARQRPPWSRASTGHCSMRRRTTRPRRCETGPACPRRPGACSSLEQANRDPYSPPGRVRARDTAAAGSRGLMCRSRRPAERSAARETGVRRRTRLACRLGLARCAVGQAGSAATFQGGTPERSTYESAAATRTSRGGCTWQAATLRQPSSVPSPPRRTPSPHPRAACCQNRTLLATARKRLTAAQTWRVQDTCPALASSTSWRKGSVWTFQTASPVRCESEPRAACRLKTARCTLALASSDSPSP